jgi:hypothetical protein
MTPLLPSCLLHLTVACLRIAEYGDSTWTRHMSITGDVLNEQPTQEEEEEEEEEEEMNHEEAIAHAKDLGRKLRKLVCAAVCSDLGIPLTKAMEDDQPPDLSHITDVEERELLLLKWKLEQKEKLLSALEMQESDKAFQPGVMSFRCARWMRTDKDVLKCRASSRQGAVFVEAMESLLWGEKAPAADELRRPLSGTNPSTPNPKLGLSPQDPNP